MSKYDHKGSNIDLLSTEILQQKYFILKSLKLRKKSGKNELFSITIMI